MMKTQTYHAWGGLRFLRNFIPSKTFEVRNLKTEAIFAYATVIRRHSLPTLRWYPYYKMYWREEMLTYATASKATKSISTISSSSSELESSSAKVSRTPDENWNKVKHLRKNAN